MLDRLRTDVENTFHTDVSVLLDTFPTITAAYSKRRDQYSAEKYIQFIKTLNFSKEEEKKILVLTSVDLFAPLMNFIFGMAENPGDVAVVSTYRLIHGSITSDRTYIRILKEVIHELGHTYGLAHCPHSDCVMHFSSTIGDVDEKKSEFCTLCNRKIT